MSLTNLFESLGPDKVSSPNASIPAITFNSNKFVSISGFPTFQGVMSADKNVLIMIYTNSGDGSLALDFSVRNNKSGVSFALADMQGTWRTNYMSLNSAYWGRSYTSIDSNGSAIFKNIMQSNGPMPDNSGSFPAIIANGENGGVFGATGSWTSTFSGVMSVNKNLMIGTVTQDPTGTPSPSLIIWMK
jgi:hypothetical protein